MKDENRVKLRTALAARDQRFTRQRAKVYDILAATDQHPTAEEVYRKVRPSMPSISLATVYKSLDALVQCRLAQKLTYGDGSARYDATVAEHPHMRDIATGRVLDVPFDMAPELNLRLPREASTQIAQRTGFQVTGLRIELLGHIRPG